MPEDPSDEELERIMRDGLTAARRTGRHRPARAGVFVPTPAPTYGVARGGGRGSGGGCRAGRRPAARERR